MEPPPLPPSPYYTLRPHSGEVTAVKYMSLGDSKSALVSGTSSGQLGVWELSRNRLIWEQHCDSPVLSVNVQPGTGRLISQCRSGTVDTWSLDQQKKESSFSITKPGFCRLATLTNCIDGTSVVPAILNQSCVVAAHSEPGKVNVYDSSSQQLVSTLQVKQPKSHGTCMCVAAYCDSGSGVVYVLGGFEDGSVVNWDTRNQATELSSLKLFPEPVMCVAYDLKRRCGVCGSPLNTLETFTCSADTVDLQRKYTIKLKNPGVSDVAIRNDSRIIVTGGWDGRIRLFGLKKGKPLAVLNYHTENVYCVSFPDHSVADDDSNVFACGSKDGRISLWTLF